MTQLGIAQKNLVPNPGFEDYGRCPVSFSTDPLHFGPNNWNSPSQGTPDYYNKCSIGDMHVPNNWAGVSHAHSGVVMQESMPGARAKRITVNLYSVN